MSMIQSPFDFDRIDRRTREITPDLIAAVKERVVQNLHPKKVVLFGSQANGTASQGSDIDLLVVLSDEHPLAALQCRDRFGEMLRLFRYRSFGLDAIILTDTEVQKLRDENEGEWDFVLEILDGGKTLYEQVPQKQTQSACLSTDTRMVS